jgi:FAD synthetase
MRFDSFRVKTVFAVAITIGVSIILTTPRPTAAFMNSRVIFGTQLANPLSAIILGNMASGNAYEVSSSPLANWRLFQDVAKDGEDAKSLRKREAWSKEVYEDSLVLYEKFVSCDDTYMNQEIKDALKSLGDALRLYGPSSVICSFNGGKDACVILELVRAAFAKFFEEHAKGSVPIRPRVVYWDKKDEFPEVIDFVKESVERYDLDMIAFDRGISFGDGLKLLVENNMPDDTTSVSIPMAFVLGTRSGDPNASGQGVFAPSSSYMPPFMRVNPIINWNYGQVWQFLRGFSLPYCSLYEEGYTSLGTCKDTLRNPALFAPGDGENEGRYRGAWMLTQYDLERAGRVSKSKTPKDSDERSTSTHLSAMSIRVSEKIPSVVGGSHNGESDFSCHDEPLTRRSVGLLVIGDEILKGYTADTNTNTAATALYNENVLLKRVVVVSDDMDEIIDEIVSCCYQK